MGINKELKKHFVFGFKKTMKTIEKNKELINLVVIR